MEWQTMRMKAFHIKPIAWRDLVSSYSTNAHLFACNSTSKPCLYRLFYFVPMFFFSFCFCFFCSHFWTFPFFSEFCWVELSLSFIEVWFPFSFRSLLTFAVWPGFAVITARKSSGIPMKFLTNFNLVKLDTLAQVEHGAGTLDRTQLVATLNW